MENLSQNKPSYIGEVFLTDNGEKDGAILEIIWENFPDALPAKRILALDGTEHWQGAMQGVDCIIEVQNLPHNLEAKLRELEDNVGQIGLARAYKIDSGVSEVIWTFVKVNNLTVEKTSYNSTSISFIGDLQQIHNH